MDQQIAPRLGTDLFPLHAPCVYDFRERDDMLFAYLSDSDRLNVTSVYEMSPWRRASVLDVYGEEAERLEHRRT
jgi:hypothetical protein